MKEFNQFASAIGERESSNNYKCVNKFGYLGRYQMGKLALYDCGYSLDNYHPKGKPVLNSLSKEKFLNDSTLQDACFRRWINLLKGRALKYSKYFGQTIKGTLITLSGVVAALHLQGEGTGKDPGVRQFLESGLDDKDGLGTKISDYIKLFNGYDLT